MPHRARRVKEVIFKAYCLDFDLENPAAARQNDHPVLRSIGQSYVPVTVAFCRPSRRLGRRVALRPTAEVGAMSLRLVAGKRATGSTLR